MAKAKNAASRFDGFTVDEVLETLAQEAKAQRPRDDEFGLSDFAARADMQLNSAARFLALQIKDGVLVKRIGLINGKRGWLYSAANKKTDVE